MQASRGAPVAPRNIRIRAAAIAAAVIALDQVTKWTVVAALREGESISVIGDVLRLTHIRNTGAAFGMLKGFGGILALVALVGVVVFAAAVVRQPAAPTALGCALVAAGAAGNLIDRFFRPDGVVDFVDFRFWPAFNVADSAITIGAIVLLASGIFEERGRAREVRDDVADAPGS